MTTFNHMAASGSVDLLIQRLGNPETTIVAGDGDVDFDDGSGDFVD